MTKETPFGGKPGGKARITSDDESALARFLMTLNDGYTQQPQLPHQALREGPHQAPQ